MGQVIALPGGINAPQFEGPPHLRRHYQALLTPRGIEVAIAALRELGQDAVMGDAWLDMARGYLALLNGPTGRLDCGTLDGEVRRWAEKFGFDEKEREGL